MTKAQPLVPLERVLLQDRRYITELASRDYPKLSVRLYGRGAVVDGAVNGASVQMKRHQLAAPGQVILSEIWGKKGAIGIVPPDGEGALCTSHFFLFDIRADAAMPDYLNEVFRSNLLQPQLGTVAKGTTSYAAVRPQHLLSCLVPLPDLPRQAEIVRSIVRTRRAVADVSANRAQLIAEAEALIIALHLGASRGRVVPLSDLVVLDETRVPVVAGGLYPQVGVKSFGKGLFAKAAVSSMETSYRYFHLLHDGALVLSQVKGWEGALGVGSAPLGGLYVSPEYRTFRCVGVNAEYLDAIIRLPWFWSRLASATRGVGARRERTRPERFLSLELPFPSLEEQYRLMPQIRKIRRVIGIQEQTAVEIDSLLPATFNVVFGDGGTLTN